MTLGHLGTEVLIDLKLEGDLVPVIAMEGQMFMVVLRLAQ
jgi:hypothetical protein